jgi:hypothetical protein
MPSQLQQMGLFQFLSALLVVAPFLSQQPKMLITTSACCLTRNFRPVYL